jgi:hypothetical protein
MSVLYIMAGVCDKGNLTSLGSQEMKEKKEET